MQFENLVMEKSADRINLQDIEVKTHEQRKVGKGNFHLSSIKIRILIDFAYPLCEELNPDGAVTSVSFAWLKGNDGDKTGGKNRWYANLGKHAPLGRQAFVRMRFGNIVEDLDHSKEYQMIAVVTYCCNAFLEAAVYNHPVGRFANYHPNGNTFDVYTFKGKSEHSHAGER